VLQQAQKHAKEQAEEHVTAHVTAHVKEHAKASLASTTSPVCRQWPRRTTPRCPCGITLRWTGGSRKF
jgi:hypothetical protein